MGKLQMIELLSLASTQHCSAAFNGFNEASMFQFGVDKKTILKEDFQRKFRNISRIIDCVSCESCKMHAKLKAQAIGTALKILFHEQDTSIKLERNEVIALLSGLAAFSRSLKIIDDMRDLERRNQAQQQLMLVVGPALILVFVGGIIYGRRGYRKKSMRAERGKV